MTTKAKKSEKFEKKKGLLFVLKKWFLSSFLQFFPKIELIHRETVQKNIIPGGIKKSVSTAHQKRVNHTVREKRVKKREKQVLFFEKKHVSERIFTFFQKNRVHS